MANNRSKKKIPRASKHRLMTIGLVCVCIFIYFCYTVISYTHKIIVLTNEEKSLKDNLNTLKTNREYLLVEIEKLQDPEYIAKYARETYYYSKDGEYILKIDKNKELLDINDSQIEKTEMEIKNIDELSSKYKYAIIIGSGLLAIVITVIIIKNKM